MAGRLEQEVRDLRVDLARMEAQLNDTPARLNQGDEAFEELRLRLDRIERTLKLVWFVGAAVLGLAAKVFIGVA